MKKILFLSQTFMFFFIIFFVQHVGSFIDMIIYLLQNGLIIKRFTEEVVLEILINITNIICILGIVLSIISILFFNYYKKGSKKLSVKITEINQDKEISLIFFATYILPLLSMDINNVGEIIGFGIILVLMIVLSIKTNLWYTNPILAILDYKIYNVKYGKENKEGIFITKDDLKKDDAVNRIEISNGVFYIKKGK